MKSIIIFIVAFFIQVLKVEKVYPNNHQADSLELILKTNKLNSQQLFDIKIDLINNFIQNQEGRVQPMLNELDEMVKSNPHKNNEGMLLLTKGVYLEKIGKFEEGLEITLLAEKTADNSAVGRKIKIKSTILRGSILRREMKIEEAYRELLKADSMAEQSKDDTILYNTKTQLGVISVTMKDYDRAIQFHTEAIEIAGKLKSNKKIARSNLNIGIIYREKDEIEKGLTYTKTGLDISYLSNDSVIISSALCEYGTMLNRSEKSLEAKPILEKAIGIMERNAIQNDLAYAYFYLASTLYKLNRNQESRILYHKAFEHAKKINNTKQVMDSYQSLYIFHNEIKMQDSAIYYLKKFVKFRDSVSGAEVQEKIQELNIKYESQKKDVKIQKERLKNSYLIGGLSFSLIGIAWLFGVFRRKKLQFKNKLQETILEEQNKATKEIIEAEEKERQRIASDLHDGVGQFMTAAKMNLESLTDKIGFQTEIDKQNFNKAIDLIQDSANEVRTISHNMMPNSLLKSGLSSAVRNFLDNLNQQKIKVQLFTDGIQLSLNSNTEIFVYRIIQECVNNVLKHANASELNISIIIEEKELTVTIEDNGVGFDSSNLESTKGIGVSNIEKRVHFLKGTIYWDSTLGKGTTVVINIPLSS